MSSSHERLVEEIRRFLGGYRNIGRLYLVQSLTSTTIEVHQTVLRLFTEMRRLRYVPLKPDSDWGKKYPALSRMKNCMARVENGNQSKQNDGSSNILGRQAISDGKCYRFRSTYRLFLPSTRATPFRLESFRNDFACLPKIVDNRLCCCYILVLYVGHGVVRPASRYIFLK